MKMMRHAFLIIAHNNWWQLKQLIQLLDADNHDIFIHVDKKSTDFRREMIENAAHCSKVTVYQEYAVYWGGFSQVQVELFLLKKAKEGLYDYYHVISGADLPLADNRTLDSFFEENRGRQFISYDEDKLLYDPEIARRTKYYHFLQNYRRRYLQKWKNDFFTFVERVSLAAQIVIGVNRVKDLDWEIHYGSNWCSITDELVAVLLENEKKITDVFSCTNCADELFVQTVAYNCGFRDQIYQPKAGEATNMRFIDWSRGKNGNPYTFSMTDLDLLSHNKNLFARKFSEVHDRQIIETICASVGERNEHHEDSM